MTKEKKIEAIYKEMANKELTLGCYYCSEVTRQQEVYDGSIGPNYIGRVIGHPVMIGDVMDYLEDISRSQFDDEEDEEYFYSREEYYEDIAELSDCWTDKRLSIDNQSDECIDYVYNLIQKD